MIAKENLKYGDIVKYNGVPCKVNIIGDGGIGVIDKAGNNTVAPENKLDGVPITSSLLRELGFKEYKNGYFGYWDGPLIICDMYQSSQDYGIWSITLNDCISNMAEIDRRFLHELQNAFKSVLEIELKIAL